MRRLVVFIALSALLLAACARHDDLPMMLSVIVPPTPENFTVATSDNIVYDLSWTVSDLTPIRTFYIYTVDILTGAPILADSTMGLSKQMNTIFQTPGIFWGVSSVSTDNIESSIVFGSAP